MNSSRSMAITLHSALPSDAGDTASLLATGGQLCNRRGVDTICASNRFVPRIAAYFRSHAGMRPPQEDM